MRAFGAGIVQRAAHLLGQTQGVAEYSIDADALRPLMDAFWSPRGWRTPPVMPPAEEWEAAVGHGVMFDEPVTLDHDGWVARVRAAVDAVSLSEVVDGFLASLTTRRLDLRSALGSYAVARYLPDHGFAPSALGRECRVCGGYKAVTVTDLNVLSFERFKWGGVRRADLAYLCFDLEQFQRAPKITPGADAIAAGRAMLDSLRRAAPTVTATTVIRDLTMIKGNAAERKTLVDILGVAGVLSTPDHPGYELEFIAFEDRDEPDHHFVERAYPACWWHGRDGVNENAVWEFLRPLT